MAFDDTLHVPLTTSCKRLANFALGGLRLADINQVFAERKSLQPLLSRGFAAGEDSRSLRLGHDLILDACARQVTSRDLEPPSFRPPNKYIDSASIAPFAA